jgi:hypothetical protein
MVISNNSRRDSAARKSLIATTDSGCTITTRPPPGCRQARGGIYAGRALRQRLIAQNRIIAVSPAIASAPGPLRMRQPPASGLHATSSLSPSLSNCPVNW